MGIIFSSGINLSFIWHVLSWLLSYDDKSLLLLYDLLLINIKNHVFKISLGDNFNCNLNSIKLPSDIENDDIIINLNNDNFKVSTKWLESLILDVFPFEYEKVNSVFGDLIDLQDYIITGECEQLQETKFIRDFILV